MTYFNGSVGLSKLLRSDELTPRFRSLLFLSGRSLQKGLRLLESPYIVQIGLNYFEVDL